LWLNGIDGDYEVLKSGYLVRPPSLERPSFPKQGSIQSFKTKCLMGLPEAASLLVLIVRRIGLLPSVPDRIVGNHTILLCPDSIK
jgi:hypothetical protein